jgi:aspartyl-tRNA(Asn)/glutamyl-tRNA(Gln) amidotransferase subunit C
MNKSTITTQEVLKLASAAKLILSKEEVIILQKQISEIIGYFDILNEVDTKNVKPTSQVTGMENVSRTDLVSNGLSQEEVLAGNTNKNLGMFKVKRILE